MNMEEIGKHIKDNVEGLTKKQGEEAYNAIVDLIKTEVNSEKEVSVSLPKLGNLNVKARDAYTAKNPRNGEPVEVQESRRISFAPFTSFKDHLNSTVRK